MRDSTPTEDDTDSDTDDLAYRIKHNMSIKSPKTDHRTKDDDILYRIKHNMSIDSSMMANPDKGEIPAGARPIKYR